MVLRRSPGRWRVPWMLMAIVAVAYTAGSTFSFWVLHAPEAIAVLFPPAGVSVAALVLSTRRDWPWVLATVFATELTIDLAHHFAIAAALGYAAANTIEPLVATLLLRRALPTTVDLRLRRDLVVFLGSAVVAGPLVGASVGATTIALTQDVHWAAAVPLFWAGDALGALAVGGTILTSPVVAGEAVPWLRLVGLLVVTAAVTVVGFLPDALLFFYLPVPVLVWIALRYGVADLTAAGLVFALTANVVTAQGHGPWAHLVGSTRGAAASLQLFLAVTILAAWLLAVVIRERESAAQMYLREHESALQLQRAMLPDVPQGLAGVDVDTLYRPADTANEVGGDWYDAFPLGDGRIGIAVGDVVGHELRAAVAMGRLHVTLRLAAAAPGAGPATVLSALDRACAVIPDALCATVGYAEYSPATGRLRYACAGHPPPLLVTADGEARYLEEGRSTPLGVVDAPRDEASGTVPPGATLVWYSDGLVERRREDIDEGLARLVTAAAAEHSEPAVDRWSGAILDAMTHDGPLDDDIVIICVRLLGAGGAGA